MSTDEPNPRCCSQCVYFKQKKPHQWGQCTTDLPWWNDEQNPTIYLPEHMAEQCLCFHPKP